MVLAACPAAAGMLLEADLAGVALRLEIGAAGNRALATVADAEYLIDLDRAEVWHEGAKVGPDLPPLSATGELEQWSEGPIVAGYGTSYHVLIVGERICGEALTVGWMAGFTDPLARALRLLERTLPDLMPKPEAGCGTLGFASFDRGAFPLLAGDREKPLFQARHLRFDHYPPDARFARPGEPVTCPAPPCPPGASPVR